MKIKKYMITLMTFCVLCATLIAIRSLGDNNDYSVETFAKTENIGQVISFDKDDFRVSKSGNNKLDALVISHVPAHGELRLSNQVLSEGDVVDFELVGSLIFCADDPTSEVIDSFSFIPVFSKTGMASDRVAVTLSVSDRVNNAPVAVNSEFNTFSGIKLCEKFKAVDADGDELTYELVTKPKKGEVTIEGDGFCYVPKENKSGKDTFEFRVRDSRGSVSNTAKVTVNIEKQASKKTFYYCDMTESPAHYAAVYLKEEGIMEGETFGGESFFYPDKPVTRAQFVALIATVSEMAMPTVSVGTGLSDNDAIPVWARPYVAAAINSGVVSGEQGEDGNRVFRAEDYITRAEAAAIIDRAVGLSDDGRALNCADVDTVPTWAQQSVVNAIAAGILRPFSDDTLRVNETVTREDAALMLYEAVCFIEEKNSSQGLLQMLFGIK